MMPPRRRFLFTAACELLKIIANATDDRIPLAARFNLVILARQYEAIAAEIVAIEGRIHAWHRSCKESRRLAEIPGIGPIVATALVAEVGDWKTFSSGRSLAAWIGLVPKQYLTGGKERLGGISKQGNRYLRWLRHCHVNRKFADHMTMAVTVHAATVAWRHVSIA